MTQHAPTIASRATAWQEDHDLRAMPLVLEEGLPALKRDARQAPGSTAGSQAYAWPGPGEMQYKEIGGRKLKTIYESKIDAARLENVWRESLAAAAALPFVNVPSAEGWPASIQGSDDGATTGFVDSVDEEGRDLHAYWADLFFWKLVSGIDYTLVEMPREEGGAAYWVPIRAGQVLEVVTLNQAGRLRPVEARIAWSPTAPTGPRDDPDNWPKAESKTVVRVYRVSEIVPEDDFGGGAPGGSVHFRESVQADVGDSRQWVWITDDWLPLVAARGVMTEIPLIPYYGNRVAPYRGRPGFQDTASLQMSLWRKILDYDERERRDARNLVAIAGAKRSETSFDGTAYWLPKGATLNLAETTGAALGALRSSHEEIRSQIRTGNLRPITASPQTTRTATEIAVQKLGADSLLEMWVLLDMASMVQALTFTAILNGSAGDSPETFVPGSVDLPHDFGLGSQGMESLWSGYIKSNGVLVPPSVVWPEAKRHQWIGETVKAEEVIAEVEANLKKTSSTEIQDDGNDND